MTVAVIGLGIMGAAIARNLVAAGFAVAGYDTDGARLAALATETASRPAIRWRRRRRARACC